MSGSAGGTVLVVDNDPVNVEFLASILDGEFELMSAATADEAMALLKATTPDAVLLDVRMPDPDGYRLCANIKQDHRLADIPVIFLTGVNDHEAEARGLEVGAVDYITKPVSPAVVRLRVRHQVELKRAREELQRLVTTDALTGLPNRRRFDEVLEREWRRLGRSRAPLSLILVDIDQFKPFNDHYGHIAGDNCLRRVAIAIAGVVSRAADLAARYGGEEFVCVLPETDRAGAVTLAERLREAVAELRVPHEFSDAAHYVTVSAGVATGHGKIGQSPLSLLGLADEQLYAAKHAGRNRVMSAVAA
jgi:diguanylate cyclase (GGDEF)-like protein